MAYEEPYGSSPANTPGRARTFNLRFRRPMLYRN